MWVETNNTDSAGNPVTSRLKPPFLDRPVVFSDNGKAQVTGEIGEQLCEHYPTVVPAGTSGDESDGDSAVTVAGDADEGDGPGDS
jgi:hypothetical protein